MCECCGQSSLEHLLADELIQSMMHADNVDPSSVRTLVTAVALRRRREGTASLARSAYDGASPQSAGYGLRDRSGP